MPFQSLNKQFKKNFKKILHSVKYGDDHRLPLGYLATHSKKPSSFYELPSTKMDEPFSSYAMFPKLSQEILVELFGAIGVRYVPEVALFELEKKTPQQAFVDFCRVFGEEEENVVNSFVLNQKIGRLQKMDALRQERAFDSRAIYKALAHKSLDEVDRLIALMREQQEKKEK